MTFPRKAFRFSPEILHQMLIDGTKHHYRIVTGIPPTAKLVQCGYVDEAMGQSFPFFYMTFEDESFPMVKEGGIPECAIITVETIQPNDQTQQP